MHPPQGCPHHGKDEVAARMAAYAFFIIMARLKIILFNKRTQFVAPLRPRRVNVRDFIKACPSHRGQRAEPSPHGNSQAAPAENFVNFFARRGRKRRSACRDGGVSFHSRQKVLSAQNFLRESFSQYSKFPTVRGYGNTSRMLEMPGRYMIMRSKPSPKPACTVPPYLRRFR